MKKNKRDVTKRLNKKSKAEQIKPAKKSKSTNKVLTQKSFTKAKFQIGPFLTATFTAILIGLFVGLVMLNMFTKKEDHATTGDYQPVAHEEVNDADQTQTEGKQSTLKQMNAYVLQLGVFSEQENANAWSDTYQLAGFPSIHFQRESQHFLFAGIAHTEEKAKELSAKLLNNDVEVYVKEWTTDEIEVELSAEESKWLSEFQELWGETLQSLNNQEGILLKEWSSLIEDHPLKSEEITQLVKAIQLLIENGDEVENDFEQQNDLLNIWKVYDEAFYDS